MWISFSRWNPIKHFRSMTFALRCVLFRLTDFLIWYWFRIEMKIGKVMNVSRDIARLTLNRLPRWFASNIFLCISISPFYSVPPGLWRKGFLIKVQKFVLRTESCLILWEYRTMYYRLKSNIGVNVRVTEFTLSRHVSLMVHTIFAQ